MFSVELAWFQFDLPDHASIEAKTSAPNPLFEGSRVTTQWTISLERFEIIAHLSATRDFTDLSRRAFENNESGLKTTHFNSGGIPAMKYGSYDQTRTQIDWWFHLHGLTLSMTLTAKGFPRTLPTETEEAEHDAIIKSVRRVEAED